MCPPAAAVRQAPLQIPKSPGWSAWRCIVEFRDSPKEAEFRAIVRSFLADYPEEYSNRPTEWGLFNAGGRGFQGGFMEFMRGWNKKLNERGWGAPAWPKEHGGGGLSVKEQFILS